jgi:hypothetical protein
MAEAPLGSIHNCALSSVVGGPYSANKGHTLSWPVLTSRSKCDCVCWEEDAKDVATHPAHWHCSRAISLSEHCDLMLFWERQQATKMCDNIIDVSRIALTRKIVNETSRIDHGNRWTSTWALCVRNLRAII